MWSGAVIHAPHPALSADYGLEPKGLYVSWVWNGSPASRYALRPTSRILEVDGAPTPDLDTFLAAIRGRADRARVRIKIVDLDGKTQVISLKVDRQYWPTAELAVGPGGWGRRELE